MIAALRYEWRRLSSIRSTWIITAIAFAQAVGFIWLFATFTNSMAVDAGGTLRPEPTDLRTIIPFIFLPFFPLIVSTLAGQAFGHDYRHGTIRLTLSNFPNRGQILLARVGLLLGFVTALSVVTVAVCVGIVELYSSTTGGIEWSTFAETALKLWAYLLMYMIVCMAIVVVTRIMALGIVIPLVMVLIVENLMVLLGMWKADWLPWLKPLHHFGCLKASKKTLKNTSAKRKPMPMRCHVGCHVAAMPSPHPQCQGRRGV